MRALHEHVALWFGQEEIDGRYDHSVLLVAQQLEMNVPQVNALLQSDCDVLNVNGTIDPAAKKFCVGLT